MVLFARKIDDYAEEDIYLTGLSVRTPWAGYEDFLVILRANIGGEAKVAFVSGNTMWEAMKTAGDSFVNKSLKWKADEYAR